MARKTTVTLIDDIDGSPADESVLFGLDGVQYEIDLSAANAGRLRESLARYIGEARRTTGRRPAAARSSASDLAAIRAWARSNGHQVSDRGRIAAPILAAYRAAHAK